MEELRKNLERRDHGMGLRGGGEMLPSQMLKPLAQAKDGTSYVKIDKGGQSFAGREWRRYQRENEGMYAQRTTVAKPEHSSAIVDAASVDKEI